MPPKPQSSDTVTAESLIIQVVGENSDLMAKYASGDLSVLGMLQERAVKLAAGRVSESELKTALMRKLNAGL